MAMSWVEYLRFPLALIFVLGLILLAGWAARRYGLAATPPGARLGKRLSIIDTIALDPRRRLILVRRDDREHLLMLGQNGEQVVEGDIPAPPKGTESGP